MIFAPWQRVALAGVPFSLSDFINAFDGFAVDPDAGGALTFATQPAVADGNMETAGVLSWLAINAATLTKDGTPHSGTQCLKVAYSTTVTPAAGQVVLVVGERHVVSLWGAGDGAKTPMYYDGVSKRWEGTNSTAWQDASSEFTAAGNQLQLYCNTAGAGYARWDDLTVSNISVNALAPSLLGASFAAESFAQATAANKPWSSTTKINGKACVQFDGTADYLAGAKATSVYKALHAAAGCTISLAFNAPNTATGNKVILATCTGAAADNGIYLAFDDANQQIIFKVANGGAALHIDAATGAGTCTRNAVHVVTVQWSSAGGYSIWIDGAAAVTGASTGSASTNNATGALRLGATTAGASFFNSRLGALSVACSGSTGRAIQLHGYHRQWAGV